MTINGKVEVTEVQRHEQATESNVRLGGYHMDRHCPTNEFQCYRVQLAKQDEDRVFLLGLTEFINLTQGQSCQLRDVVQAASAIPRVVSFIEAGIDLQSRPGLELVVVARELQSAPLVVIDGNHRAIAQFFSQGSVEGVSAFVCVHPAIGQWPFIPPLARTHAPHA
jgi:hypothetical protein